MQFMSEGEREMTYDTCHTLKYFHIFQNFQLWWLMKVAMVFLYCYIFPFDINFKIFWFLTFSFYFIHYKRHKQNKMILQSTTRLNRVTALAGNIITLIIYFHFCNLQSVLQSTHNILNQQYLKVKQSKFDGACYFYCLWLWFYSVKWWIIWLLYPLLVSLQCECHVTRQWQPR